MILFEYLVSAYKMEAKFDYQIKIKPLIGFCHNIQGLKHRYSVTNITYFFHFILLSLKLKSVHFYKMTPLFASLNMVFI